MTPEQAELARLFDDASHAVAFTGAGISTECGIPDFRSPGGLWTQNKPIPYDAFLSSQEARNEAWRRKFAMDEAFSGAKPGRGHRALAHLVQAGKMRGVITQNIDNLHQDSGLTDEEVIEIHGNTTYARCVGCQTRFSLDWVRARYEASGGQAPDCDACLAPVKTATISFGQAMPEAHMARARTWARRSDLFLVLGSSLVVFPAAYLPVEAKNAGATLVIINREPTEMDHMADLVIHDDLGDVLSVFLPHP